MAVAVALAGQATVVAKGPVDQIRLATSSCTFSITGGQALTDFTPWSDDLLGPVLDSAPAASEQITVSFWIESDTGNLELIYTLFYQRDPLGGPGFVHLPERGSAQYGLNVSTILRGSEGRWHRATALWDGVVGGFSCVRPPVTGDSGLK